VRWTTGSGDNEFYAYDAAGNRVLRRSTSGGSTTMTVYAFGLEEHFYSGTGTSQGNTYYYSLAGRLIGELTGTTPKTNIFLTDPLGSVLATFSNTAGTAALLGNQVYGPYGTQRYSSGGTMGTNKGFTGQYNDSLTGLDYYNARYYDPVVGVFLAVDTVQGNLQGMNPYAYVGGNPETKNDPTGQYLSDPTGHYRAYVVPDGSPTKGDPYGTKNGFTLEEFFPSNPAVLNSRIWKQAIHFNAQGNVNKIRSSETPRKVAEEARDYFDQVTTAFTYLSGDKILSMITMGLNFHPKLTSVQLSALAVIMQVLGALTNISSVLADGFRLEAGKSDDWFTLANIKSQGASMLSKASSADVGVTVQLGAMSAIIGAIIGAIPGLELVGAAIVAGGFTEAVLVNLGAAGLMASANHYIDLEEV
jgi:RHS repeat-associated protein